MTKFVALDKLVYFKMGFTGIFLPAELYPVLMWLIVFLLELFLGF